MTGSAKVPAPPPAPEPLDIIDEVGGFEQVTVTGPDGKKQIVRRALPLSPEAQALADQYQRIVADAVTSIEDLSAPELATQIAEFQPALQAFREQTARGLEKATQARIRAEEEGLARRGLEESTAGTELRAIRGQQIQEQQVQAQQEEVLLAEQLRNQAIARQQNLLGLATGQQQAATQTALSSLGQLQQSQLGLLGAQQNAANAAYNAQLQQAQANQASRASTLGAFATLGGYALGGPLGSALSTKIFGGK